MTSERLLAPESASPEEAGYSPHAPTGLRALILLYSLVQWIRDPRADYALLLWLLLFVLTLLLAQPDRRRSTPWLAAASDGVALWLIAMLAPLNSAAVALPLLLMFRAFVLPAPRARLLPIALVAFYLLAVSQQHGLSLWRQLDSWLALILLLAAALVIATLATALQEERSQLRQRAMERLRERNAFESRHRAASETATSLAAQLADMHTLSEVVRAVNGATRPSEVVTLIEAQIAQEFEGSRTSVLLYADGAFTLLNGRAAGHDDAMLALARRQRQREAPLLMQRGTVAAMVVPLMVDDRQSGTLIAWREREMPFTKAELQRLESFVAQAALAVHNSRLLATSEQAWQESEAQRALLMAVLTRLEDGVLVTTLDGRVLLTNPVASRFLTLKEQSDNGDDQFAHHVNHMGQMLRAGQYGAAVTDDLRLTTGAQSSYFQLVSMLLHHPDQRPRGVVTVIHDMTDEWRVEELKRNFVSNVSHELRNPLNIIKNSVEHLLKKSSSLGPLTDDQREFLEMTQAEGRKLEQLVTDLLEFQQQDMLRNALVVAPLNMSSLLHAQRLAFRYQAITQKIRFDHQIEAELQMQGDVRRLEQVLRNLLVNAFKFTPDGGRIALHGERRGDGQIHITVADSGIGIPASQHERIFERFYQVETALHRSHDGIGVGLALSKQIVSQHGGRIWVEDNHPAGSAFHILLPPAPPNHSLPDELTPSRRSAQSQ